MFSCLEASGNSTKAWILRIAALIVGGCLVSSSGPILGFTAYANAYKATYSLTQTQVEWSMSIAVLGHNLGFHVQWCNTHLGPRLTALTAGSILAVGFGLLYSSTFMPDFYHDYPWLLHLYCFIMGFGCVTAVFISLSVNPYNFLEKHRAKIIGCMDFSYNLGTGIVALIFYCGFAGGGNIAPEDQDLQGFFLLNTISWAIVGIIGWFFLAYVPPYSVAEQEAITLNADGSTEEEVIDFKHEQVNNNDSINETSTEIVDSVTWLQALKQPEYLALLWFFGIAGGLQLMFFNNISTFLHSTHHSSYALSFTIFGAVVMSVFCIIIGGLSDAYRNIPRIYFVFVAAVCMVICNIILVFYLDNIVVYGISLCLIAICDAATWAITQTILSELWGEKYFPSHLTLFFVCTAIVNGVLQLLLGYFYDSLIPEESKEEGETHCYGNECFTDVFIISIVLQFTGILCLIFLCYKHRYSYTNRALEAAHAEKAPLISS